ncbi:MAG: helix-turn-helix domain-containing protein, partial [Gloeotrichia echinulata HAB0833]
EMLRVLLKRLIIKLTRLAMNQHLHEETSQPDLDLIRQYSLLVENNYRRLHQVQDYAELLNKSPKTLANLFAQNQQPSPLAVITNRIALEGRRLLTYTDKTISEIGFELGFEESAHFSRFFKQAVGKTPRDFRISYQNSISGKIGK